MLFKVVYYETKMTDAFRLSYLWQSSRGQVTMGKYCLETLSFLDFFLELSELRILLLVTHRVIQYKYNYVMIMCILIYS